MLGDQQFLGALQERTGILDRSAEIAGCALAVLNRKSVIAAMPFQALVAQPKSVAIGRGNCRGRLGSAAFRRREIKPEAPQPEGPFQIVEADVNIALRVVSILGNDVGPRGREIRHRHLADAKIPILDPGAITAHVQGIEIIDLDMLAAVVAFTGPELGIRLAFEDVAAAHKGLAEPELIVAIVARKIGVAGGIRGVGLNHYFRFQPRFIVIVCRVEPIVDENEFSIRFRFVAESILGVSTGSLKGDLLTAFAVEAITRSEVTVKFKALHLLIQFLYLLVCLSEEIICRL